MRKIILGFCIMFLFTQHSFANKNAECKHDVYMEQTILCSDLATDHKFTGDFNECIKALKMVQALPESHFSRVVFLSINAHHAALMAYFQNELPTAYKYWKIASKDGDMDAHDALNRLCKESPWVCK